MRIPIFIVAVGLLLIACSDTQIDDGFTPISYDTCVGDNADYCLRVASLFNMDPEGCGRITDADVKQLCVDEHTGKFMDREYSEGAEVNMNPNPFASSCRSLCEGEGMDFKERAMGEIASVEVLLGADPVREVGYYALTCYCY